MSDAEIMRTKTMKKYVTWVSKPEQLLSFKRKAGYDEKSTNSNDEMWNLIYEYIEAGYRVE